LHASDDATTNEDRGGILGVDEDQLGQPMGSRLFGGSSADQQPHQCFIDP
jgi:hypothetical protein